MGEGKANSFEEWEAPCRWLWRWRNGDGEGDEEAEMVLAMAKASRNPGDTAETSFFSTTNT